VVAGRTYVERPAGFSTSTIKVFRARGQFDRHEAHPSRPTRQPRPCCARIDKSQTESRLLAARTDTGLVFTHEDGHAMQFQQPMKRALSPPR